MDPISNPSGAIIAVFLFYVFLFFIGLAFTIFWVVELIDVARREFRDQNTKILWLVVVLVSHFIGSLVYYFVGKPQGWLPGAAPKYPPQTPYGQPPPAPPENRQE